LLSAGETLCAVIVERAANSSAAIRLWNIDFNFISINPLKKIATPEEPPWRE
jgi:hypothetical protein